MTAETEVDEIATNAEASETESSKPERRAFVMPFLFDTSDAHDLKTLLREWCEPIVTGSLTKAAVMLGGLVLVGVVLAPALLSLTSNRFLYLSPKDDTLDPASLLLLIGLGSVVGLTALFALAASLFNEGGEESVRQRGIVKQLARYNDVRVVRPLIHTLGWADYRCQSEARYGLLRMLPVLDESDGPLFSDYDRSVLTDHIQDSDAALRLAILNAMVYIGRSSDLRAMRAIAEGSGRRFPNEERGLAQACVAAIEERAQHENALQTLLRPAGSENVNPGEMVRPAIAPAVDPPEQLLRPRCESP